MDLDVVALCLDLGLLDSIVATCENDVELLVLGVVELVGYYGLVDLEVGVDLEHEAELIRII